MKLHNLQPAAGSTHSSRRIGRGPGSGLGGTSTRGHIQALADSKGLAKVTVSDLIEAGFVSKKHLVKILGNGQLTAKLEVEANAFSKTAEEAIKAAGGSVTIL